jgi:hypothetical protein
MVSSLIPKSVGPITTVVLKRGEEEDHARQYAHSSKRQAKPEEFDASRAGLPCDKAVKDKEQARARADKPPRAQLSCGQARQPDPSGTWRESHMPSD